MLTDEIDKPNHLHVISIDGCDEETLAELMYYGREMLMQDLLDHQKKKKIFKKIQKQLW